MLSSSCAGVALLVLSVASTVWAQTDYSGVTGNGNGWRLVFRHKTAVHDGGAMWTRVQWRQARRK